MLAGLASQLALRNPVSGVTAGHHVAWLFIILGIQTLGLILVLEASHSLGHLLALFRFLLVLFDPLYFYLALELISQFIQRFSGILIRIV